MLSTKYIYSFQYLERALKKKKRKKIVTFYTDKAEWF